MSHVWVSASGVPERASEQDAGTTGSWLSSPGKWALFSGLAQACCHPQFHQHQHPPLSTIPGGQPVTSLTFRCTCVSPLARLQRVRRTQYLWRESGVQVAGWEGRWDTWILGALDLSREVKWTDVHLRIPANDRTNCTGWKWSRGGNSRGEARPEDAGLPRQRHQGSRRAWELPHVTVSVTSVRPSSRLQDSRAS